METVDLKMAKVKKITDTGKVRAKRARVFGVILLKESFCLDMAKIRMENTKAIAKRYSTT